MKIQKETKYVIEGKQATLIGSIGVLNFLKLTDDHVLYIATDNMIVGSINIKPSYNNETNYIDVDWSISNNLQDTNNFDMSNIFKVPSIKSIDGFKALKFALDNLRNYGDNL